MSDQRDTIIDRVVMEYRDNRKTLRKVSKIVGYSRPVVTQMLMSRGVFIRGHGPMKENIEIVRQHSIEHRDPEDIGRDFGMTKWGVLEVVNNHKGVALKGDQMLRMHSFISCTVMHEGKPHRAMECKCGGCTYSTKITLNSIQANPCDFDEQTFAFVKKKLERTGWYVGKSARHDRCPACLEEQRRIVSDARKKEAAPLTKFSEFPNPPVIPTKPVSVLPPGGVVAGEVVRLSTVKDNKAIRDVLDEVYGSEDVGYIPGWTDAKVAERLSCPRAWVTDIRERLYGKTTTNPEIENTLKEARRIHDATTECLKSFEVRRTELSELLRTSELVLRDLEAKYK